MPLGGMSLMCSSLNPPRSWLYLNPLQKKKKNAYFINTLQWIMRRGCRQVGAYSLQFHSPWLRATWKRKITPYVNLIHKSVRNKAACFSHFVTFAISMMLFATNSWTFLSASSLTTVTLAQRIECLILTPYHFTNANWLPQNSSE